MSGDGFGGLFAIGIGLLFLPVIIKAAMVAATIALAVGAGMAIINVVDEIDRQKRIKKTQTVTNCSKDLDKLYKNMQKAFDQQADADKKFYNDMANIFKDTQKDLEKITEKDIDTEDFEKKLDKMKAQAFAKFKKNKEDYLKVRDQDNKKLHQEYIKTYNKALELKTDLLNFKDQTETAKAQQRGVAELVLKDAKASVDLLKLMADSSKDVSFQREVNALIKSYNNAVESFNSGSYEAVIATSKKIVTDSAVLNYEQSDKDLRLVEMRGELRAKLIGLKDPLEEQRYLTFNLKDVTNNPADDDELEEDLDEYSGGAYEALQDQIDKLIEKLPDIEGQDDEAYQLQMLDQLYDNELLQKADQVVKRSQAYLLNRYRELEIIKRLNKFMREQNYRLDWVENVGDDLSGKIVAHYVNKATNDKMVFTLDNDDPEQDPHNIVIEHMNFYENNVTLSEQDLANFREKALKAIGLRGNITCDKTTANKEAKDKDYNDKEKVLNKEVTR